MQYKKHIRLHRIDPVSHDRDSIRSRAVQLPHATIETGRSVIHPCRYLNLHAECALSCRRICQSRSCDAGHLSASLCGRLADVGQRRLGANEVLYTWRTSQHTRFSLFWLSTVPTLWCCSADSTGRYIGNVSRPGRLRSVNGTTHFRARLRVLH